MGVDRWIDQQLSPDRVDDAAFERVLAAYPTGTMRANELLQEFPPPGAKLIAARLRGDSVVSRADSVAIREQARRGRVFVSGLLSERVARAVGSERQLQEVMTDFWLNHFNVFIGKGQLRYYLGEYERDVIRPHAFGKFRDLLGAVAKSPAMLLYLDNAQSVADSGRPTLAVRQSPPRLTRVRRRLGGRGVIRGVVAGGANGGGGAAGANSSAGAGAGGQLLAQLQSRRARGINENYARELLELHTLGVDGGYTQQDIQEVARAFTGWTVRPPRLGGAGFYFNPRTHDAGSKSILGHHLKSGRGVEDGDEVLDIVARHPSTARFIAKKLAIRLVSDTPPAALVDRAAETFRRTDGDIRAVVRTIVTSPEFFSRAAFHSKVKSPFEVVVSTARALGGVPDTTALSSLAVARLGQPIFGHQAPNGWPETGEAWMNTGAILARINFGLSVGANRLPGSRPREWEGYARLASASRTDQVDGIISAILGGSVSPQTRAILVSGENPMLQQERERRRMPNDSVATDGLGREEDDGMSGVAAMAAGRASVTTASTATATTATASAAAQVAGSTEGGPPQNQNNARSSQVPDRRIAGIRAALRERTNRPLPALSGLDQIIGLALGSPEFQRR